MTQPRTLGFGALAVATILVAALLLAGGNPYELHVRLSNASQLVKGNVVKVGGLPVGVVKEITLTDDNQADIRISVSKDDLTPLHQGTKAIVRFSSLSGIANRYLALEPGPNNARPLPSGAVIPTADTKVPIEIDTLVSTLDAEGRSDLQRLARGGAAVYAGKAAEQANRGLAALNPAVAQLQGTLAELNRDRGAFERLIVASAGAVSAVAARENDLQAGLASTARTSQALAAERESLGRLLVKAPRTLRQGSGTLTRVASTLQAVEPAIREARPVAPRLSRLVSDLDPVLDRLGPALREVRPLMPALRTWLAGVPAIRKLALPALDAATASLQVSLPIITGTRIYAPDIVIGATNGFGGTAAGPYDANGAYARISFIGIRGVTTGGLGLPGYSERNSRRCPGAATQVAPDKSNVVDTTGLSQPCVESQRP